MKMYPIKAICISLLTLSLSTSLSAQKAAVETASLSLRTYNKEGEKDEMKIHSLQEAKASIDKAANNETTANDPKMWMLKAEIYLAIYTDKHGEGGKSVIEDPDALETAANAIISLHKAEGNSKKYSEKAEAYSAFVNIGVNTRYIADVSYNNKDYARSVKYYKLTRSLIPYDDQSQLKRQNITDDGMLFNIATTEKLAENYPEAKKQFLKLIDKNYNDPWVYLELYDIQLNVDHDTTEAIKTIDKGRLMFEDNNNLKQQQIFAYSASGRSQELLDILNRDIEADPYNGSNFYLRALMNIRLGNEALAITDFEKAVELDDQNLTAYEELGQLYYKSGANLTDEANALPLSKADKYNELNAQAKEAWTKAIPCFEKIKDYSSDPKVSGRAAQFLMQLYPKTGQMDKFKALKAEYE